MGVAGIGIDIVEVSRVAEVIARHGQRFLSRVFTPREVAYCRSRKRIDEHFAARWAAKEATVKALRMAFEGAVSWRDIEVTTGEMGEPRIKLQGTAAQLTKKQGIAHLHLSISHVSSLAVACVVAETEDKTSRPS
jgi:holo-[acyl-carrier protein] synthase